MKKLKILGTEISFPDKNEEIIKKQGYYIFANSYTLVEAKKNMALKKSLDNSTANFPDGFPLVWLARLNGIKSTRFSGPDVLPRLIAYIQRENIKCCFLGGSKLQSISRIKFIKKNIQK